MKKTVSGQILDREVQLWRLFDSRLTVLCLLLLASPGFCNAQKVPKLSRQMMGGEFQHIVQRGDSLTSLGARFGVETRVIAEANSLNSATALKPGQKVIIDNRHLVPVPEREGILINLPQRMLFYLRGNDFTGYPVALGRPNWQTPARPFTVVSKEEDPVWDVPVSIQEEMRRQGKNVITQVPPCPNNPLGQYWLGLDLPGFGIHGTDAPTSIYQFRTHGCIRLHPEDIADLFCRVAVGTQGNIVYEPVLLGQLHGAVFLEVHRDIYRRGIDLLQTVRSLAATHGIGRLLDWKRVEEVVRKREGVAREVSYAIDF